MSRQPSKKDLLLEAGLDIFFEKGFERATIDEIVDRANCGKGTFYRYFQSKETLLNKLEERFRKAIMQELEENCPFSLPVEEFLLAALKTFVRVFKVNHRLGLVKFAHDQQTGIKLSEDDKNPAGMIYLENYIKQSIAEKKLRELSVPSFKAVLFGAVHFFVFRDFKLGISLSERELKDTVDLILNGALPS
ncbi:MAG: TetR/AcrR family transcriptional regulator [Candidatus Riflebacteria bacterium]|nr:TetR/AcrR family transcriptional regulator [Candidatus Riflebacteria bacterium]